ncbi:MAG: HFX_2341 family transcriptional regulator domain-containing protein [Promethearchaeota archaeon]
MPFTHLIFVGHRKDVYMDSVKKLMKYHINKVILIVGDNLEYSGEEKVHKIAEEMKKELKSFWEVGIAEINKIDIIIAIEQLLEIIKNENKSGNVVLINASGSLRTLAIAGYIICCLTGSKIITSLPEYDKTGKEIGVKEIIEMPLLQIKIPGSEHLEILTKIKGTLDSMDDLILGLKPDLERRSKGFMNERSRISHHVSKLEEMGYIKREKAGRNVKVSLTPLGKLIRRINSEI